MMSLEIYDHSKFTYTRPAHTAGRFGAERGAGMSQWPSADPPDHCAARDLSARSLTVMRPVPPDIVGICTAKAPGRSSVPPRTRPDAARASAWWVLRSSRWQYPGAGPPSSTRKPSPTVLAPARWFGGAAVLGGAPAQSGRRGLRWRRARARSHARARSSALAGDRAGAHAAISTAPSAPRPSWRSASTPLTYPPLPDRRGPVKPGAMMIVSNPIPPRRENCSTATADASLRPCEGKGR